MEEEYGMQQSWRQDADKLTFIMCLPIRQQHQHQHQPFVTSAEDQDQWQDQDIEGNYHDSPDKMLGDVNLFLRIEEDEEDDDDDGDEGEKGENPTARIVGEIELMVAEKRNHRLGYGRAALLSFLKYIEDHEGEILSEFVNADHVVRQKVISAVSSQAKAGMTANTSSSSSSSSSSTTTTTTAAATSQSVSSTTELKEEQPSLKLAYLSAKIEHNNFKSLALFESLSFRRVSDKPNYFGEFELRREDLTLRGLDKLLERADIGGQVERMYRPL